MAREMITHSQAYKSAEMLFDYCNNRECCMCIFAEDIKGQKTYECNLKHIIPCRGMGNDKPFALLSTKENIDILRKKGRGK